MDWSFNVENGFVSDRFGNRLVPPDLAGGRRTAPEIREKVFGQVLPPVETEGESISNGPDICVLHVRLRDDRKVLPCRRESARAKLRREMTSKNWWQRILARMSRLAQVMIGLPGVSADESQRLGQKVRDRRAPE